MRTVLQPTKTTQQRRFTYRQTKETGTGYEIHMGHTTVLGDPSPVARLDDGLPDGYFQSSRCWGTYLHGILDNDVVVNDVLADYTEQANESSFDFWQFKEQQYDKLADVIRANIDMAQIYASLTLDK